MRVQKIEIDDTQGAMINLCIIGIEQALNAQMLAIVMQDANGIFVRYRPGDESTIARRLAGVNWGVAARVAEEHTA